MVVALTAPALGWGTLCLGWTALSLVLARAWRVRRRGRDPVLGALALVLGGMFLVGTTVHGLSLWADASAPRAIALDDALEVRDGPGTHRKIAFVLQGGSRVRIVDRSPGWCRIRLEGGLEGWVPERAVGGLDGEADLPALARALPPGTPPPP